MRMQEGCDQRKAGYVVRHFGVDGMTYRGCLYNGETGKTYMFSGSTREELEAKLTQRELEPDGDQLFRVPYHLHEGAPLRRQNGLIKVYKERRGDAVYCYCDLTQELVGIEKRIYARSVEELRIRIEMEEDALREQRYATEQAEAFCSDHVTRQSAQMQERWMKIIRALPTGEQRLVLSLLVRAAFGDEIERDAARNVLYIRMGIWNEKKRLDRAEKRKRSIRELDRFSSAEAEAQQVDRDTFSGYLNRFLETNKTVSASKLAERVGCDKSTISRYRRGKIANIQRELVIRLAVAMGLSKDDMCVFINAAGFTFPRTKKDRIIMSCMDRGICDYDKIRWTIEESDPELDF